MPREIATNEAKKVMVENNGLLEQIITEQFLCFAVHYSTKVSYLILFVFVCTVKV
jgi:hypothetical protein